MPREIGFGRIRNAGYVDIKADYSSFWHGILNKFQKNRVDRVNFSYNLR
jgi:hypothetical protein